MDAENLMRNPQSLMKTVTSLHYLTSNLEKVSILKSENLKSSLFNLKRIKYLERGQKLEDAVVMKTFVTNFHSENHFLHKKNL